MNLLSREKRTQIIAMLCDSNSMRALTRMADVARNTVDKLLCDLGRVSLDYQDRITVNLPCRLMQCERAPRTCACSSLAGTAVGPQRTARPAAIIRRPRSPKGPSSPRRPSSPALRHTSVLRALPGLRGPGVRSYLVKSLAFLLAVKYSS